MKTSRVKCREYALGALSRRAMSCRELYDKCVQREYPEDEINSVIEYFTRIGALNDRDYAERVAQVYSERGYGRRNIVNKLKLKKIPNEIIEELFEDTEESTEPIDAFIALRLHGNTQPDDAEKKKITSKLIYRGFTFSQIREAWARLDIEVDEEY